MRTLLVNIVFIVTFSACFTDASGQREHFVNSGVGWSHTLTRDRGMSPLMYSGGSVFAFAGYQEETAKHWLRAELFFRFGRLSRNNASASDHAPQVTLIKPDIDLHYLKPLGYLTDYNIEAFAGLSWQTYGTYKEHEGYSNNAINHEFASSLGITGNIRKHFSLFQHPLEVNLRMSLPFLAYTIRPSYASSLPEELIHERDERVLGYFKSGKLQTIPDYSRIQTRIGAHYEFMNGNEVRLSYYWDLYRFGPVNEVIAGYQGVLITTAFRL